MAGSQLCPIALSACEAVPALCLVLVPLILCSYSLQPAVRHDRMSGSLSTPLHSSLASGIVASQNSGRNAAFPALACCLPIVGRAELSNPCSFLVLVRVPIGFLCLFLNFPSLHQHSFIPSRHFHDWTLGFVRTLSHLRSPHFQHVPVITFFLTSRII